MPRPPEPTGPRSSRQERDLPRITAQRRAQRRAQIVDGAIRCVMRAGFQGTTMAQVIEESGLSAGAVYGYFSSKDDLLAAVADSRLGDMDAVLQRALAEPTAQHPADVVAALVEQVLTMARHVDGDLTVVVVQIWGQAVLGGQVRGILAPRLRELLGTLTEVLRRWRDAGHLRGDADPVPMARVIFAMLPGYMLQRLVLEEVSPAVFARGLRDLMDGVGDRLSPPTPGPCRT